MTAREKLATHGCIVIAAIKLELPSSVRPERGEDANPRPADYVEGVRAVRHHEVVHVLDRVLGGD